MHRGSASHRGTWSAALGVAVVVVVGLGSASMLSACSDGASSDAQGKGKPKSPGADEAKSAEGGEGAPDSSTRTPLPEGVTPLTIADPRDFWTGGGYVNLVPPVHLPSVSRDRAEVEIWAKLPDPGAGLIELDASGERFVFPPGSVLDRVEYRVKDGKRYVVDVRGTTVDADAAQRYHVYRRGPEGLFGFEWVRGDTDAHDAATDALIARLAEVPPGSKMKAKARDEYLQSVRGKNDCFGCHLLSRATNARQNEHGLVNRGTDASGFFTPQTLFAEVIPVEKYGKFDRNHTDPRVTVACPADGEVQIVHDKPWCDEKAVPQGRYDLVGALAAAEPRARQVCAGRKYLADHASAAIRDRFAKALESCEPPQTPPPNPEDRSATK